uniref:Uncharacterized protein n=1 Tax=Rhizophora mucronata TaxID=61149 RepID=A0A2P2PL50_RHIMU
MLLHFVERFPSGLMRNFKRLITLLYWELEFHTLAAYVFSFGFSIFSPLIDVLFFKEHFLLHASIAAMRL